MLNQDRRGRAKIFVLLICAIWIGLSILGCEPLRKKFTRKKKEPVKKELPVLEPIEYPTKTYSPQDLYRHHFNLWKLWTKELVDEFLSQGNRKRRIYTIDQAITNLEVARDQLTETKKEKLDGYVDKLKSFKRNMSLSVSVGSDATLKTKLQSLEKDIRLKFSFSAVSEDIKKEN